MIQEYLNSIVCEMAEMSMILDKGTFVQIA